VSVVSVDGALRFIQGLEFKIEWCAFMILHRLGEHETFMYVWYSIFLEGVMEYSGL
jgi:hypothetical protein